MSTAAVVVAFLLSYSAAGALVSGFVAARFEHDSDQGLIATLGAFFWPIAVLLMVLAPVYRVGLNWDERAQARQLRRAHRKALPEARVVKQ